MARNLTFLQAFRGEGQRRRRVGRSPRCARLGKLKRAPPMRRSRLDMARLQVRFAWMDRPGGLSYRSDNGSEFPGLDLQCRVVLFGNKGLYCLTGGLVTSEILISYGNGRAVSGLPGIAG